METSRPLAQSRGRSGVSGQLAAVVDSANLLIYCSAMATLPVEGRWSIKSISNDDVGTALAFLRRDPLINVYLISRILEERFSSTTQTVEVRHNREVVLVASLATNIV